MKFAAIRDLQIKASDVVKKSQKEPVVITSHGKIMAVMTQISEDEIEDFLFENSPKLRKRIEEGLKDIEEGKVISHEDLEKKIKGAPYSIAKAVQRIAGVQENSRRLMMYKSSKAGMAVGKSRRKTKVTKRKK